MAMKPSGVRKIVVGVDGSAHAAFALDWAVRMAKGMGAEVIAVFAISPPVYLDAGYTPPIVLPQFDPVWRAEMKKEFEGEWCKQLQDSDVRHRMIVADGRAASVIAQVADEAGADVIVIGRRGRGGVAELLLGSVSHELVLHCKRPVLVISSAPQQ